MWRSRKSEFESSKWWEVGKAHIQVFCQQYTSHSTVRVKKKVIQDLEKEIRDLENRLSPHDSADGHRLQQKNQE